MTRSCSVNNNIQSRTQNIQLRSVESFSYKNIEDVINIENNLFLEKQVDEYDKTFIHAHDIFISSEDNIEIDHISLINTARKLKKKLQQRLA